MRNSYLLEYPAKIIFGCGRLAELPVNLPPNARILLVTGNHAVRSGLQKQLIELLGDFTVIPFSGISPEPPLEDADRLIELGRKEKISAVIAVGGGSVIDTAKTAACIIPAGGRTADYFSGKEKITGKGLFMAALPTTAGTGTEVTRNAVLTDAASKIKKSIRHSSMIPDLALIDPALTLSASAALTAASGMDAFTQAVESFISSEANSVSKSLARSSVRLIHGSLAETCGHLDNMELRSRMAEGSLLSAMAFSQSGLGAVHGLAHPIGSLLKVPHGICCAILLVPILKWNLPACEKEFCELAQICGGHGAEDFVGKVSGLCSELGIASDFSEFGLSPEHYPFIIQNCRSNSMKCNPRQMSDNDIENILKGL